MSIYFVYIKKVTKKMVHMCPPNLNEVIPEDVYATQGRTQVGDSYAKTSLNFVQLYEITRDKKFQISENFTPFTVKMKMYVCHVYMQNKHTIKIHTKTAYIPHLDTHKHKYVLNTPHIFCNTCLRTHTQTHTQSYINTHTRTSTVN